MTFLCLAAAPAGSGWQRLWRKKRCGPLSSRGDIGGACVNIACLPSKDVIHTAKVASLVRRHQKFGIQTGLTAVNMSGVYAHKRKMVDEIVRVYRDRYEAAGDELILGDGRFIGQRTLRAALREGGERTISRCFRLR